jgi:hypothetical protein
MSAAKYEYQHSSIEVYSGTGKGGVAKMEKELATCLQQMASAGWRLVSTGEEIYTGRTTWIRLFWERERG